MAEPVDLAEIKQHLDVARDDQDDMLNGMIVAAREWVENYTGLILAPREVVRVFDDFCSRMELNVWPVAPDAAVTVSYTSSSGVAATVAGARVFTTIRPVRVNPAFGMMWPLPALGEPIVITVAAGYATPADVPFSLKAAIKLIVGDLYGQREGTAVGVSVQSTGAIENLCHPYRMPVIG